LNGQNTERADVPMGLIAPENFIAFSHRGRVPNVVRRNALFVHPWVTRNGLSPFTIAKQRLRRVNTTQTSHTQSNRHWNKSL